MIYWFKIKIVDSHHFHDIMEMIAVDTNQYRILGHTHDSPVSSILNYQASIFGMFFGINRDIEATVLFNDKDICEMAEMAFHMFIDEKRKESSVALAA